MNPGLVGGIVWGVLGCFWGFGVGLRVFVTGGGHGGCMKWEEHLKIAWELAWDLGGIVFWAQLRDCGITATEWHQVVKNADIKRKSRGVYVLGELHDRLSVLKQAVAILPRAVVSHEAAALMHGFVGFSSEVPVVTVHASTTHVLEGVVVHRNTDLKAAHTEGHGNLVVTNRLRTIVDLSYQIGYDKTAKLLDRGVRKGWFSHGDVVAMWQELGRRGKPGSANLRRYVNERRANPTAHSKQVVREAFHQAGISLDRVRVEVPWEEGHFFDLASQEARVGVRLTGRRSHHEQVDQHATQITVAEEHGWTLIHLSNTDIAKRLDTVVFEIKDQLAAREPA